MTRELIERIFLAARACIRSTTRRRRTRREPPYAREAFDAAMEPLNDRLLRVALRVVGASHEHDARDAVQEAMAATFAAGRVDLENPVGYLITAVEREAIRICNRRVRRREVKLEEDR